MALLGACSSLNAPSTMPPFTPTSPLPPATLAIQPTTALFTHETPVPGIAATVTAVHKIPALSANQILPYTAIGEMVTACAEFHSNRQIAVLQHLNWLANPHTLPPEFISLYGNDAQAKLAFGAVYLVAVQWKTDGRPPESCLIPIGNSLNKIVVEFGGKPVPEFSAP